MNLTHADILRSVAGAMHHLANPGTTYRGNPIPVRECLAVEVRIHIRHLRGLLEEGPLPKEAHGVPVRYAEKPLPDHWDIDAMCVIFDEKQGKERRSRGVIRRLPRSA